MKLLHLVPSLDPALGGPSEMVPQLARALAEQGHENTIACMDAPGSPWLGRTGTRVEALGPGAGKYRFARAFERWLREHGREFDAVLVNGVWQWHSLAAWRALAGGPVPYFVFPHGMLDPWFQRAHPIKHLKKVVYWKLAEHRVLRDAACVLFTAEHERAVTATAFRPYAVREAVVSYGTRAPDGDAEAQRAAFLAKFPALAGKRLILFLARLAVKKGGDLLVEAFAREAADPALHLVMAGPDEGMRAELEQRARALGVAERVTFTGLLQGDLKWGAFRAAEAFVLPSHQESFGMAVVEALALGVPALISDQVPIWHEVQSGGGGLVAPDDVPGTRSLLARWLALSPAERAATGERARALFAERFEIGRIARNVVAVIEGRR